MLARVTTDGVTAQMSAGDWRKVQDRIAELEAALAAEYRNLVFMVERMAIPNVLDDIIHTETRRVLGDKAEKLKAGR